MLLCGRQNIPLRGHTDNLTDVESDSQQDANHGNFHALLQFRIEAGDTVLREHLAHGSRNAMYMSSVIKNQIIDILADQIHQKILEKVIAAQWYTVVADEVTDCSNTEQLSMVLRYVDPETSLIREDLVDFPECNTGIIGRCLADKITSCLQSYGLDLMKLRGQAYDGAGNVAGTVRGTAAVITSQYPLAVYTHCASHCLNLAVVKSLQITSVRNMMGVIEKVYQFFAVHPKHQQVFEQAKVQKLKDLCRTRWVQ